MADGDGTHSRLWVISELYYPEDTSTGYYLTRIAEGLAERSADSVQVLCGRPTYAARGQTTSWQETHRGVKIQRCWGTTWNKDRLLLRVVNLLTLSLSMFFLAAWRFRRGDRVLVVTNPPLLPFVISWACRLRRAWCLLLIHDVYPDVAVAAGLLSSKSFLTKIMDLAVGRLYRSMERIVVLGRDMQELVLQKLPPDDDRVQIIPNWADTDLVKPKSRIPNENRILNEFGLHEKFVVQYSGNMGRSHDLETLIACARRLQSRDDIHFLLVGNGAKKAWLKRTASEQKLQNVTVADRRPRADLPELLTAGDVALIPFVSGMTGISVPSRLYNMLAAGTPIIALAEAHSELAQVIKEENAGWVVPCQDAEGLTCAILAAVADLGRRKQMGKNARLAAECSYQFSQILDLYCQLMEVASQELPSDHTVFRRAA